MLKKFKCRRNLHIIAIGFLFTFLFICYLRSIGSGMESLEVNANNVVEQIAQEMPSKSMVTLKMTNLRLHSSGVFSNVYRGTLIDPTPLREIAIKKTWPDTTDKNFEHLFLMGISRERHKNIVNMLYFFSNNGKDGKICESYVFDFMPSTLASLIRQGQPDQNDIKLYTWQLFNGLRFLATNLIAHRDIKPINILIDHKSGILKIGDFGSAKVIKKNMQSTAYQVTRFYRPPELLLNATVYNHTVDLWSGGCVVGEMLRGGVLFPGKDTKHQLRLVFSALGSPSESEIRAMKVKVRFEGAAVKESGLVQLMPDVSRDAVDIVRRILVYNPKQRLGGSDLLLDPWFDSLFADGARRSNGQLIGDVIQRGDLSEVRNVRQVNKQSREQMKKEEDAQKSQEDENAPTVVMQMPKPERQVVQQRKTSKPSNVQKDKPNASKERMPSQEKLVSKEKVISKERVNSKEKIEKNVIEDNLANPEEQKQTPATQPTAVQRRRKSSSNASNPPPPSVAQPAPIVRQKKSKTVTNFFRRRSSAGTSGKRD